MVGGKKKTLYHNNTFERMEMSRGGFKDWNLVKFS
jgi:hypothetical protein